MPALGLRLEPQLKCCWESAMHEVNIRTRQHCPCECHPPRPIQQVQVTTPPEFVFRDHDLTVRDNFGFPRYWTTGSTMSMSWSASNTLTLRNPVAWT